MSRAVLSIEINSQGALGLWTTNGTPAGTFELTGIAGASSNGISPVSLTVFHDHAIFDGVDAAGNNGLWVTDGTVSGDIRTNRNKWSVYR